MRSSPLLLHRLQVDGSADALVTGDLRSTEARGLTQPRVSAGRTLVASRFSRSCGCFSASVQRYEKPHHGLAVNELQPGGEGRLRPWILFSAVAELSALAGKPSPIESYDLQQVSIDLGSPSAS